MPGEGTCGWRVVNDIQHTPKPSPLTDGETADVHAKWCDCPFDVKTRKGRAACQKGPYFCLGQTNSFDTALEWVELHTAPYVGPVASWAQAGPEKYSYPLVFAVQARSVWDYFALGSAHVFHVPTGGPYLPGVHDPSEAAINGVLWNSVRDMIKFPPGSILYGAIRESGNHYGPGDARIVQTGKLFIITPYPFPSIDRPMPCLDCPFVEYTNLLLDPDFIGPARDPLASRVSPSGVRVSPELLSPSARSDLLKAQRGELRLASGVESPGLLAELSASSAFLAGILVDPQSGAPVSALFQTSLDAPLESAPLVRSPGIAALGAAANATAQILATLRVAPPAEDQSTPGALQPGEALVLSAEHGLLHRFGGKHPQVAAAAWIYGVEDGRWSQVTLEKKATPGSVMAATFQRKDGYVYLMDSPPTGPTGPIWLVRWRPGASRFEPLARWTGKFLGYERYWLVPSEDGELYAVASKKGASVIARFTASGQFAGVHFLNRQILERPIAGGGRLAFAVHVPVVGAVEPFFGVRQEHVVTDAITQRPKGWSPTVWDPTVDR
jgi:hypothetical protein